MKMVLGTWRCRFRPVWCERRTGPTRTKMPAPWCEGSFRYSIANPTLSPTTLSTSITNKLEKRAASNICWKLNFHNRNFAWRKYKKRKTKYKDKKKIERMEKWRRWKEKKNFPYLNFERNILCLKLHNVSAVCTNFLFKQVSSI